MAIYVNIRYLSVSDLLESKQTGLSRLCLSLICTTSSFLSFHILYVNVIVANNDELFW